VPVLTADAARKQIASGKVQPVYLLVGDDEWEQADLAAAFTDLVDEDFRAFNVERFYASERPQEAEASAVAAARGLPMMSPRRIVFLLRAERLLKLKGRRAEADEEGAGEERGNAKSAAGPLEDYLKAPEPMTTLVIVAADANKTLRLVKALYTHAAVVECWGLKDGREAKGWQLPGIARKAESWVRQKVAEEGRRIDPDATRLLADRAGADLGRLRADVDRLILYAGERTRLTRGDVEAVAGAETSHDAFAVTSAVEQGRTGDALKQLALLLDAGAASFMVLGQLGWLVRERLGPAQPARARAMLDAVLRTDLDLKTSGGDPRVLLERLVVELSGGPAPDRRAPAPGSGLRGR
jgi:DNA polymerase-3 subunit delta